MAGIVIPAMLSSLPTIPNRPHPEEAALLRRRLEGWTQALTRSILRDASLRDAPQDEAGVWYLNMSRWYETVVSLIQFG
jgi:hypothetical protein